MIENTNTESDLFTMHLENADRETLDELVRITGVKHYSSLIRMAIREYLKKERLEK